MTAPIRKPHARGAHAPRSAPATIDTVIVAFTDMQGRLVGKRVSARLFLEDVAEHGAECCNYLLAVDVEMNTVDGYAMSSWERGYGDMAMIPDLAHAAARAVAARRPRSSRPTCTWLDGTPVDASPAPDPASAQLERLAERGLDAVRRHRARVHRLRRQLPGRLGARGTAT